MFAPAEAGEPGLSRQISGTLSVLTIVGLPLGTALCVLQVLVDKSPAHLFLALGAFVAATAGALATRYGRLVPAPLRGGDASGAERRS
ncbi:hypothetical protein [Streptomyces sp. CO7]